MFKRIILFLFIVTTIIAQDFTGIRIYINPGHGGHDSDDRYIAATGFWESEGNLGKGLHLRDILNSLNATTKISRTTNNTNDDLGLSVIVADANNFDADYMHSIHSNAFNGSSNYTLVLFQGGDNTPTYPQAKIMGGYISDEIYKAHRTSTKYNRGDADFYGTGQPYLGVFKGLTMPGTLSEGSFHDYIPESFRLKNDAYLDHEAWAITKAFIKYFNLDLLPYGEIAGIARDAFEDVDYPYINAGDKKKPANLVKAILMPDSILYLGDSFNNGFFLFDKVQPGTYDIIIEAENYELDTVQATVSANKTSFADVYLIEKPNYSAPIVEKFLPQETENVKLDSDIIIEFNVKMDRVSVEQSFSISPNISGTFNWENNDKRMIFSPTGFLKGGTNYTIGLNTFVKSYYNVLIEQPFSKSFNTRSALSLINSYPDQSSENISRTVKLIYKFDAPINANQLGGNIFFQDMDNVDISLAIDEIDYINGRIIFEPQKPLDANTNYKVKLLSGIKDIEGSNLGKDTTIIFKTESNIITEGIEIFNFEEIGSWLQPQQSETTSGIISNDTKFQISTKKYISGTHSGRLIYKFSEDSSGICRLFNDSENINSIGSQGNFGIWIFGDLSYNNLQLWFTNPDSSIVQANLENIDWTGWKFKEVNLPQYPEAKFNSFVIVQNKVGAKSGQLYFDDALTNIITEVKVSENTLPEDFRLEQNYPNPFNPTTTIKYTIPMMTVISNPQRGERSLEQNVQLIVYDVLGREIKTLVDEVKSPGNYEVTFDATNLPSGVYYYQLKSGDFIQTKKMLLLK